MTGNVHCLYFVTSSSSFWNLIVKGLELVASHLNTCGSPTLLSPPKSIWLFIFFVPSCGNPSLKFVFGRTQSNFEFKQTWNRFKLSEKLLSFYNWVFFIRALTYFNGWRTELWSWDTSGRIQESLNIAESSNFFVQFRVGFLIDLDIVSKFDIRIITGWCLWSYTRVKEIKV